MAVQHNRLKNLRQRLQNQEVTPEELAKPWEIHQAIRMMRPHDAGIPLIRMGPDSDGGYLVPDDLDGIKACFSPGVGRQYGFELDCLRKGMEVYMADGSVPQPDDLPDGMHFLPRYLMTKVEFSDVHLTDYRKGSITLKSWVSESGLEEQDELMLQMDVEGFEYDILLAQSDTFRKRFRVMVVEFHGLDLLCISSFCAEFRQLFGKLLGTHEIVHVHPNNNPERLFPVAGIAIPRLLEITFLRKDRFRKKRRATVFPHPLDRPNIPHKMPVDLPGIFYRDGPGTWKYLFQEKAAALKRKAAGYHPSVRRLHFKKKRLISQIYGRGHLPAIVMTCDRYAALTRHMIRCYEMLWPDHPFEFLIPYQDPRRRESHGRMHFIETGKGFKETVMTLLDGFSDEQWVYWCIDDKFPIQLDVPKLDRLARAVIEDDCDGLFCLNLESLAPQIDPEHPVPVGDVNMYPCRRYIRPWRHKFIRVSHLRILFDYIPPLIPFPRMMDAILAQTLIPESHRYKVHDTIVPFGLFGESTREGRITRACHESMQRLGMELPSGFTVEHHG
jgi:hypothetical protein